MLELIESENRYLALETGGSLFAIPISDIKAIVTGTQAIRHTVLPHMPDCVKCVAMVDGQLTTIITFPGDKANVHMLGKPIVILAYPKRTIGVLANRVDLIAIPEESISVDRVTMTRTYVKDSNIFFIVDIKDLLRDEEYSSL